MKEPISSEMVRSYPKVEKDVSKQSKKGKLPGKSRVYTDAPEK